MINTEKVTDDCFSSLSPRCSLTDMQLFIHVLKTAKCKTVTIFVLRNRFFKTRWFVDDEELRLHNHTLTSLCFSFSFEPWFTASDSYQLRGRWLVLLCSISPTPRSEVFLLIFDVSSPKCFVQPGDHHPCRASNTGYALKKRKEIFKNYSTS